MEIQYEIHYKKNAKRIIIKSDHRGGLIITSPYGLSRSKIDKIVKSNEKRLSRLITDKSKVYYLGKEYKIIENIWNLNSNKVIKEDKYIVVFKQKDNKTFDVINDWLKEMAKIIISKRVEHYASILNVRPKRIRIKPLSTIWGSCNFKGELSFNYLLVKTPIKMIDYVVVHELSHIKHLNHSKKFWYLVEKVIPDYKKRELWLKENVSILA